MQIVNGCAVDNGVPQIPAPTQSTAVRHARRLMISNGTSAPYMYIVGPLVSQWHERPGMDGAYHSSFVSLKCAINERYCRLQPTSHTWFRSVTLDATSIERVCAAAVATGVAISAYSHSDDLSE